MRFSNSSESIIPTVPPPSRHVSNPTYSAEGLLIPHQVNDEGCGRDEEDLHEGVVQGNEVHEEVQVAHAED